MSDARSGVGDLRITKEAAFMGATTGSQYTLAILDSPGESGWTDGIHPDETMQATITEHGSGPKKGRREAPLSLPCKMGALTAGITDAAAEDAFHALLVACMGGGITSAGDVAATGCTTNTIKVVSETGMNPGAFVLINGEAAIIITSSAGEITIDPPISSSSVPAATDLVYGSLTALVADAARDTYQVEYHKEGSKVAWRLQGVTMIPKFSNLSRGEGPAKVSFDGAGADYTEISSDIGSAAAADLCTQEGPIAMGGRFALTDGTDTLTGGIAKFSPTVPLGFSNRADGTAQNGNGAPTSVKAEGSIELTLAQGAADADPIDQLKLWLTNKTALRCIYQIGTEAGDTIAFYFPRVYVNATPIPVDVDGLIGIDTKLKISSLSADTLTSPMYVGRM